MENLSLVPHLEEVRATIFVCDQRSEPLSADFLYHHPNVKVVTGEQYLDNLGGYDVVFRSPGLPVGELEKRLGGLKNPPVVSSATDLFLGLTASTVIGVTGTKGKGTTSTMIGSILEAAGKKSVVAGNIGKPIFSIIDELTPDTIVVLELSSFQLEDVTHSPHIAVVLPIGEDHLKPLSTESPNFHRSLNDYVAAKAHITLHQNEGDVIIFAADNPDASAIANISKAKKIAVSQTAYQNHWNVGPRGEVYRNGEPFLELAKTGLRGQHIFLNATMAAAATTELGIDSEAITRGLTAFQPLPHRLQKCATIDGVMFVDDSYATNPEATMAALTAFTESVVLIAGGSSKGANFTELGKKIADSSVTTVVLIGQEAPRLKQAIQGAKANVAIIDGGQTMNEAVNLAKQHAVKGGVVLLSPACASKDMFINAAERGDQFQAAASEK